MKLTDLYDSVKSKYPDYIVFIKSGNFYLTYENDGIIINYIFSYKVVNGKVGFPLDAKGKIEEELKKRKVNYIFDDTKNEFNDNSYYILLKEASDDKIANNMVNSINMKIKEKILKNPSNYNKILEYINEL